MSAVVVGLVHLVYDDTSRRLPDIIRDPIQMFHLKVKAIIWP